MRYHKTLAELMAEGRRDWKEVALWYSLILNAMLAFGLATTLIGMATRH